MSERKPIAAAEIPSDQVFRYRVVPLPGRLMQAVHVGRQLQALGSLMRSLTRDYGTPEDAYLTAISMNLDGSIEFELATLPVIPGETK